jgi:general secretion pathway protein D
MTINRANALGAEWRLLDYANAGNERVVVGGTNLPSQGSSGLINQMASQPFAGPAGLVLGAAEGTLTWGGTTFMNIGALVQALEQDSDVNILSTPHLLTMDNEEARIVVGQERPFLKSSMSAATGAVTPSVTNTYEFKDLGLTLKITPHITQGGFVKLKIFQQMKSFISESETGAISSTKREAETTVVVKNRETVVIGGLIGNEERETHGQVPCMGDIPLLGWAFKRRTQSGDKQNLLILIKPSIIMTAEDMKAATDRKIQEQKKSSLTDKDRKKCAEDRKICTECEKAPPVCPQGDDCEARKKCRDACRRLADCPAGWEDEPREFPAKGLDLLKD